MLRNKGLLTVINWICMILGLACLLVVGFSMGIYAAQQSYSLPVIFFWVFGGFLLIHYLTAFLHEMGHAFFGALSGYKMVAFGIGKWQFIFKNNKMELVKREAIPSALAQYIPVKKDKSVRGDILMFSGGLLVHVFILVLALTYGLLTKTWGLALPMALFQLSFIIWNINPNGISDGAKILELLTYPEHVSYLYVELERSAQVFLAPEEACLQDYCQDVPLKVGGIIQAVYLNATDCILIQGQVEQARERYLAVYEFSENAYIRTLAGACLLFTYLLEADKDRALPLTKDKSIQNLLKQPMAILQIIKAYQEDLIFEDRKKALASLDKADKLMPYSYLLQDERAYFETCAKDLRDKLEM